MNRRRAATVAAAVPAGAVTLGAAPRSNHVYFNRRVALIIRYLHLSPDVMQLAVNGMLFTIVLRLAYLAT